MNNADLQQIISDSNNVLKIIDELNNCFIYIYQRLQMKIIKQNNSNIDYNNINNFHSPILYYLNGHCPSYANILCEIFGEYAIKYNSNDHVVVKIGEHFYDVRGLIDNLITDEFRKTEIDDLVYIDIYFGIKDSLEQPIEKELINIGKNALEQLSTNLSNGKTI